MYPAQNADGKYRDKTNKNDSVDDPFIKLDNQKQKEYNAENYGSEE